MLTEFPITKRASGLARHIIDGPSNANRDAYVLYQGVDLEAGHQYGVWSEAPDGRFRFSLKDMATDETVAYSSFIDVGWYESEHWACASRDGGVCIDLDTFEYVEAQL